MEEDFPRGGFVSRSDRLQKSTTDERVLFGEPRSEKKGTKRKFREDFNVKAKRWKVGGDGDGDGVSVKTKEIDLLTEEKLCTEMLLIGSVKEICDYELIVGLPNGVHGSVSIVDIADAYRDQLSKFTAMSNSEERDAEDLEMHTLRDLFKVGQILPCKVVHCKKIKKWKYIVKLTINPKHVNENLVGAALKNCMTLYGSIASVEDHGYLLDLGVKGIRGFLSSNNAEKFIQLRNEGVPLKIGQNMAYRILDDTDMFESLTWERRIVSVTIDPQKVVKAMMSAPMKVAMTSLLPGMKVSANILRTSVDGITVEFLSYRGTIHKTHLPQSPLKYSSNEEILCCISVIHPITKTFVLSALPHIVGYEGVSSTSHLSKLRIGLVIKQAEVINVVMGQGIFLSLQDGLVGYASLRNLSDNPVDIIGKEFKRGTVHKCRVLDMDFVDNIAVVTLRRSVINRQFMSIADIKPGQLIQCTLKRMNVGGMIVKVTNKIQGFVPCLHFADVTVKCPEKMFTEQQKLKCRVLSCDPSRHRMILTHKKSLVATKLPVITEFEQIVTGLEMDGFIVDIKDFGVLVAFFNNIRGWVPKENLGLEPMQFPSHVFDRGQVVRCGIVDVNPETQNITLTLLVEEKVEDKSAVRSKPVDIPSDFHVGKVEGKSAVKSKPVDIPSDFHVGKVEGKSVVRSKPVDIPSDFHVGKVEGKSAVRSKPVDIPSDFHVGKLVKCKVIKKTENGFDVHSLHSGKTAFLPWYHLSDSTKLSETLFGSYEVGDVIDDAMCHSCVNIIIVTRKKTLKDFSANRLLITDFSKLKPGTMLAGSVKNLTNYGIFVEFPGGLFGLAPNKFATDKTAPDLSLLFKPGQTVLAKVTEVKEKNQRFLISLRMIDCYHGDYQVGIDLLKNYLEEKEKVMQYILHSRGGCRKLAKVKVGNVYRAVVESITAEGFHCQLFKGVNGFIPRDQIKDRSTDITIKEVVEVVVLNKDPALSCLELSAKQNLVKIINQRKEKSFSEAKVGQVITSEVELIKEDFILVSLSGHTDGQFAYLPARKHLNDVLERHQFDVGQPLHVVIKEHKAGKIIAILQIDDTKAEVTNFQQKSDIEQHDPGKKHALQVGMMVKAKIRSILFEQMNVQIDEAPARIHVTEIVDSIKMADNPFSEYKKGMEVTAKVIGFREPTTHKKGYMPISSPRAKVAIPELSLRPSMKKLDATQIEKCLAKKYIVGDKLLAFVQHHTKHCVWMHVSPTVRGRVYFLNLSNDLQVLENPGVNFLPGQCYEATVVTAQKDGSIELSLTGIKEQVTRGSEVKAMIRHVKKNIGLFVQLAEGYKGVIRLDDIADEYTYSPLSNFRVGQIIRCHVVSADPDDCENCVLSLRKYSVDKEESESCIGPVHQADGEQTKKIDSRKRKSSGSASSLMKKKHVKSLVLDTDSGVDTNQESDLEGQVLALTDAPRLQLEAGFSWDTDFKLPKQRDVSEHSDSSSDESDVEGKQIKRKKSREEIKKERQEEERQIFELEKRQLEGNLEPQTASDFDRLILQSPDSSLVWLRYMAFHLETTEIDKARAVAERGLKTISFREEQEKMNLWVGLMNLENLYGTPETLTAVLNRAVQQNEALDVYKQIINIYVKSGKMQAAERIHSMLVKRYIQNKHVWVGFGQFYFREGNSDSARRLMQRCLKSLNSKKEHIEIISKFAAMEYKFPVGEPERGRTMFESILASYPKRTDLWSVYIDMLIGQNDNEVVRQLFERVIRLKLPSKKMKFFFKKYLEFEKKHGNEKRVDIVKKKALQYVESQQIID